MVRRCGRKYAVLVLHFVRLAYNEHTYNTSHHDGVTQQLLLPPIISCREAVDEYSLDHAWMSAGSNATCITITPRVYGVCVTEYAVRLFAGRVERDQSDQQIRTL